MTRIVGIYKITAPTGKIYIGQSRNVSFRWRQYDKDKIRKKNNRKVDNSILKYGYESHQFELLHQLPKDVEQSVLNEYEQLYIDLYRACKVELMNLRDAGYHGLYSEESKIRMRNAQLGKKSSPEAIEKRRAKIIGKKRSAETIRKISNANKGKVRSEEYRLKFSLSRKGIPRSAESVLKTAKALKGRKLTEEHKAKIAASNKKVVRKPASEDTKLKMSLAHKGRKKSPEAIRKSSIARTGQKRTPEQRERIRQAALRYLETKKLQNALS